MNEAAKDVRSDHFAVHNLTTSLQMNTLDERGSLHLNLGKTIVQSTIKNQNAIGCTQ